MSELEEMDWDRALRPYERRLNALPLDRGLLFAACCIDRSAWRFENDHPAGHDGLRAALPQTTALLWSHPLPLWPGQPAFEPGVALIREWESVIDEYEDHSHAQPYQYLSYACMYALWRGLGFTDDHGGPSPFSIAAYAHSYTSYRAELASVAPDPVGNEPDPYDRACAECVDDLAYQVSVAALILSGAEVHRSELPHRRRSVGA